MGVFSRVNRLLTKITFGVGVMFFKLNSSSSAIKTFEGMGVREVVGRPEGLHSRSTIGLTIVKAGNSLKTPVSDIKRRKEHSIPLTEVNFHLAFCERSPSQREK